MQLDCNKLRIGLHDIWTANNRRSNSDKQIVSKRCLVMVPNTPPPPWMQTAIKTLRSPNTRMTNLLALSVEMMTWYVHLSWQMVFLLSLHRPHFFALPIHLWELHCHLTYQRNSGCAQTPLIHAILAIAILGGKLRTWILCDCMRN